jgi:Family of unknown function (DUF6152)
MNLSKSRFLAAGMVLLGGPIQAHHAFSAEFDANQSVTLNGSIVKVEWQNPHARVYMVVKPRVGPATNWEFELPSPNGLMRQGWSRDSLKRGDALTVSGYLARDGSHLASARSIRFGDGRLVVLGSSGDGGPAK